MAVVLKTTALLGPPYSVPIGGVSVAWTRGVTGRQQTRWDVRVAMALDRRRKIRRQTRRYRAAAPRPAGRRCSRFCSVRTRNVSCGGEPHGHSLWYALPARLRTSVRRKSCGMRPGQPAATRAFRQALLNPPLAGLLALRAAEDIPGDGAPLPLQRLGDLLLIVEEPPEGAGEREDPPVIVLGRAGIESYLAGLHVHLPPLQRQDLARRAPTDDVRERHDGLQVDRQMVLHADELLRLESPRRGVSCARRSQRICATPSS
jgi:hypothetical protein